MRIMILLALLQLSFLAGEQLPCCLPDEIKMADVVEVKEERKITVADRLKDLKAHCRDGKLYDANNREIRFYRLTGCWGNPPANYLEILERQAEELKTLKNRYTVIEMTCNRGAADIL